MNPQLTNSVFRNDSRSKGESSTTKADGKDKAQLTKEWGDTRFGAAAQVGHAFAHCVPTRTSSTLKLDDEDMATLDAKDMGADGAVAPNPVDCP
ncbi:hypothetical protein L1887_58566 [Cichorium endivia]|nr:hypothetical protein L1887_58566 [Cichorium endivia]